MTSEDHLLPTVLGDVVFVEVIDSVEAIISAKDVDRVFVNNSNVSVSRSWRYIISADLSPFVRLGIELEEVVLSVHAIVTTEDEE